LNQKESSVSQSPVPGGWSHDRAYSSAISVATPVALAIPNTIDEDIDGFDEEEDTSNDADADSWWREISGEQDVDRLTNAEILKLGNKV
jgi:hypothetical protein